MYTKASLVEGVQPFYVLVFIQYNIKELMEFFTRCLLTFQNSGDGRERSLNFLLPFTGSVLVFSLPPPPPTSYLLFSHPSVPSTSHSLEFQYNFPPTCFNTQYLSLQIPKGVVIPAGDQTRDLISLLMWRVTTVVAVTFQHSNG